MKWSGNWRGSLLVLELDLIELFVKPLAKNGRYLIAGSVGSMLYGEPRFTLGVDLAVSFSPAQIQALPCIFPEPEYYCPPIEVLVSESKRECRGHFNVIHIASGWKADFYPSHDEFFSWAWQNRKEVSHGEVNVAYAPAEYIIVWKVAYFAEGGGDKHVRDIRRMLDLSGEDIDLNVVRAELRRRNLEEVFVKLTSA